MIYKNILEYTIEIFTNIRLLIWSQVYTKLSFLNLQVDADVILKLNSLKISALARGHDMECLLPGHYNYRSLIIGLILYTRRGLSRSERWNPEL